MIIWLASYPKSGNTWLRSLMTSYYFSKDGEFNFKLLKNIKSYPSIDFFRKYPDKFNTPESTSKYWIKEQQNINKAKDLVILKTHNAMCKINGNVFTDKDNSLGAIHIVRDPRNVITSLAHHYQIELDEALEFMITKNKALIETEGTRFLGFNAIFSWALHEESWSNCQKFPVLSIRYEDLELNPYETISKVLKFISKLSLIEKNINKKKLIKSIKSCSFSKLQEMEKEQGFQEAMMDKKTKDKIKFFNLGNKNNYKNILDQNLVKKMNLIFEKQLKKYNYN